MHTNSFLHIYSDAVETFVTADAGGKYVANVRKPV